MKLIKKKKVDYEELLSDKRIEKNQKRLVRNGVIGTIIGLGTIAFYKYDNLVLNSELPLKQQLIDNVALMFAKMGNEVYLTCGLLLSLMYFKCEYSSIKDAIAYKKIIKNNIENDNFKLTKKSKILATKLKSSVLKLGSYALYFLGYLATTKNISVNASAENFLEMVMSNINWAVEGVINEPIIALMFATPAFVLGRCAYKYKIKAMADENQNNVIAQKSKNEGYISQKEDKKVPVVGLDINFGGDEK